MLHFKNWYCCKKSVHLLKVVFLFALFTIAACSSTLSNQDGQSDSQTSSIWGGKDFLLDTAEFETTIRRIANADQDTSEVALFLKQHYLSPSAPVIADSLSVSDKKVVDSLSKSGKPLFIDRSSAPAIVDSIIVVLENSRAHGFNPESFCLTQIKKDLNILRQETIKDNAETQKQSTNDSTKISEQSLNDSINKQSQTANDSIESQSQVLARLEYYLLKNYLTYVAGQQFGFIRPDLLLNNLGTASSSGSAKTSTKNNNKRKTKSKVLFNVRMSHPDSAYLSNIIADLIAGKAIECAEKATPNDSLYLRLKQELSQTDSVEYRQKLMCNMERCRWREASPMNQVGKHIVVNIPAQHLYAIGGDTLLDMRIVCGTLKNKTPLLTSKIERMEVNPEWNVPVNIIRGELAYHAGDSAYYTRNRYYIISRETGDTIAPKTTTVQMLRSGKYRIVQRRGPGNSLGRIVFRFKNPFSVFLHDTSSKRAFHRENRTLSHGCVRVQKPLDLALYMLPNEKEWTHDKIRISMGIKPKTKQGKEWLKEKEQELKAKGETVDCHTLIRHKEVSPHIPLYITYYTLFFDHEGTLQSYPDRYGYDKVLLEAIKPLTK